MSLLFVPKIPGAMNFAGCSKVLKNKFPARTVRNWTTEDLQTIINLRAINLTYKECGNVMGVSGCVISSAVDANNLYSAINKKRKKVIAEVLENAKFTKTDESS